VVDVSEAGVQAEGSGPTEWPIRIRVERGKCLEMARALRATTPSLLEGVPLRAVPTFPVVMNHWGTVGSDIIRSLGYDLTRTLHGSEEFEYPDGPLQEGMEIAGHMRLVSRERKTNRSGRGMTIVSFRAELKRADTGKLAVAINRTLIILDPS
jgi:hypothetical protein